MPADPEAAAGEGASARPDGRVDGRAAYLGVLRALLLTLAPPVAAEGSS